MLSLHFIYSAELRTSYRRIPTLTVLSPKQIIKSERKQFVTPGEDINPHLDSDSGMTPALTVLFS